MGQPIIETSTEAEGWVKQGEVHDARADVSQTWGNPIVYAGDEGYENIQIVVGYDDNGPVYWSVPNGTKGIVPLLNGVPNYNAQITWLWSPPQPTPDGTFEVPVPSGINPTLSGTETQDYGLYERPTEWDDLDYDTDTLSARFDKTEFK